MVKVKGLNDHPEFINWRGGDKDGTPDGPKLHSVIVDHGDPRHLLVGMSSGGVFESRDEGASWTPLNKGIDMDFAPPKEDGSEYDYGHDPHCLVMHPLDNQRLYQQNHCGIYRMERPGATWERIGANMPKKVGDIGFPLVLHPRDPKKLWVFPMDGTSVWPRTSPDGRPAAYRTTNAGRTWQRQDCGLPPAQGWFTVKRQAMTADEHDPVGLYFGTTNGEVWASRNEGAKWACIARHLPHIYAVEAVPA